MRRFTDVFQNQATLLLAKPEDQLVFTILLLAFNAHPSLDLHEDLV